MIQHKSKSKHLITVFDGLDKTSQQSLLDYAEFLQSRSGRNNNLEPGSLQEPGSIPAREGESVIQALKRMSANYPMLDRSRLLNDTSVLVTEHTLQGRDREEVIAELELIFKQHYQSYLDEGIKQ